MSHSALVQLRYCTVNGQSLRLRSNLIAIRCGSLLCSSSCRTHHHLEERRERASDQRSEEVRNRGSILLASTMKSWSSVILNDLISGSDTTTRGLPSNFSSFASMSPKVLDTERRPGNTRSGPTISYACCWSYTFSPPCYRDWFLCYVAWVLAAEDQTGQPTIAAVIWSYLTGRFCHLRGLFAFVLVHRLACGLSTVCIPLNHHRLRAQLVNRLRSRRNMYRQQSKWLSHRNHYDRLFQLLERVQGKRLQRLQIHSSELPSGSRGSCSLWWPEKRIDWITATTLLLTNWWRLSRRKSAQLTPPWPS